MFYRLGIDAGTMDDVSRNAGVAKPAIYRLFPNKTSLIEAALDKASAEMETALACWPDPREVVSRALAFARRDPDLFLLLFRTARDHPEFCNHYRRLEDLTAAQLIVLVIHPDEGPPPPAVSRAAYALGALLHEAMTRHAREAPEQEDAAFLDWCALTIAGWTTTTKSLLPQSC